MLNWSLMDLAKAARLSISTVKRIEDGNPHHASDEAYRMLHDALQAEGVRFIPDDGDGPGVRLRVR